MLRINIVEGIGLVIRLAEGLTCVTGVHGTKDSQAAYCAAYKTDIYPDNL